MKEPLDYHDAWFETRRLSGDAAHHDVTSLMALKSVVRRHMLPPGRFAVLLGDYSRIVHNYVTIQIAVFCNSRYLLLSPHCLLIIGRVMSVNTLVSEGIERNARDENYRLPPVTAGMVILGLSLLSWVPLLLPIYAFLHH